MIVMVYVRAGHYNAISLSCSNTVVPHPVAWIRGANSAVCNALYQIHVQNGPSRPHDGRGVNGRHEFLFFVPISGCKAVRDILLVPHLYLFRLCVVMDTCLWLGCFVECT